MLTFQAGTIIVLTYFEIQPSNVVRELNFYSQVFGWKFFNVMTKKRL